MRSVVFAAGAISLIAVATMAVGAADPSQRAFEIDNTAQASFCVPGADYSAAACNAAQADPDAPIATARYLGDPIASPASAAAAGAPLQMSVLREASHRPQTTPAPSSLARTMPPSAAPPEKVAGAVAEPLTMARNGAGAGPSRQTSFAYQAATAASRLAQSSATRNRVGELKDFGARARIFLFAGNGSRMLAYNFTRDDSGVQGGGWSMERATRIGDTQIGVAWQSSRTRIALVGMERKFTQFFGASMKDQLVAVRLSFFPGRPASPPPS